jgi:rubrerythrin
MSTKENLAAAFAGESQANRKYLAFAKKADEDGFRQVAKLFRAAAEAETIHAHAHLRVMGGVGTTGDNLKAAVAGENEEFLDMYPKFVAAAIAEGNRAAQITFSNAHAVEGVHAQLYKDALHSIQAGKDLPEGAIYVCAICGNTVSVAPEKCPICGAPKAKFAEIK